MSNADRPAHPLRKTTPSWLLSNQADRDRPYVPANDTDVRKTFASARAKAALLSKNEPSATITTPEPTPTWSALGGW